MTTLRKVKWSGFPVQVVGLPPAKWDSETGFQIYAMTWLRKQYTLTGKIEYKNWHHSANERSNGREGFIAKLSGQSKGFPDLVHLGLEIAIELKVPGGTVSREQKEWGIYLQEIGWHFEVVFNFDKFVEVVESRIKEMAGQDS